ncbi:MAG TPA: hypothetical protein VKB94_08140 [Rhizomicrobium sp.]|nr:hypothetical protein [Rhizomicrobium sp.]
MTSSVSAAELAGTARLYVQQLDAEREALFLVRLEPSQYRAASFLDNRILDGAAAIGWVPYAPIEAVARHIIPLPLHFIFHAGHVGSTLLSRLLDEVPGILGLREPLPLRRLAELHDRRGDDAQFRSLLATMLRLWGRGFDGSEMVVLKATSNAGRIAPQVLQACPDARAIYLNLDPEPYIATLMAGSNTRNDLEGMTLERIARLQRILGVVVDAAGPLSLGEGAAVAWLSERFAQQLAGRLGPRVMSLNFDNWLFDIEGGLRRVLAHLSLPADLAAGLACSSVLTRYAKMPDDHPYSPMLRRQLLDQARHEQRDEIMRGLRFLDILGSQHAAVAALLE